MIATFDTTYALYLRKGDVVFTHPDGFKGIASVEHREFSTLIHFETGEVEAVSLYQKVLVLSKKL